MKHYIHTTNTVKSRDTIYFLYINIEDKFRACIDSLELGYVIIKVIIALIYMIVVRTSQVSLLYL